MTLPLITETQARNLIGKSFDTLRNAGFIIPFGLKNLPSELYDTKKVESAPWRMKMSYACNNGARQNKYRHAIKWVGQYIK